MYTFVLEHAKCGYDVHALATIMFLMDCTAVLSSRNNNIMYFPLQT